MLSIPNPGSAPTAGPRAPLVSCVMVTRDRPEWARHAVDLFLRQDYPNLELVIVEDGPPTLAGRLPADDRIRLDSTGAARRSIGALRNRSVDLARGELVIIWDDDDWYGPDRVTRQVAPILDGGADVTGLTECVWLEIVPWRAWRVRHQDQERLLFHGLCCGTLAFRRSLYDAGARFADVSLAEDVAFLAEVLHAGARLRRLKAGESYLYVRHGSNSWRLRCGSFGGAAAWRRTAVPAAVPAADLAFLRERAKCLAAGPPLISCLMPTADRRPFVARAIEYFRRQDHPTRELVVVDDGADPVEDLLDGVDRVQYHRLARRTVLGAKRNLAVELASGDVLAHWDDDDWYSPDRLTTQLARLTASGADVTGVRTLPFYVPATRSGWTYRWPSHRRPWVAGTSMVFRRSLWERNQFPEVAGGEDTRFVWRAPPGTVVAHDDPVVVAMVHPGNTVRKNLVGAYWQPLAASTVEGLLGTDLPFYLAGQEHVVRSARTAAEVYQGPVAAILGK